jgi:hypothetical protein
MMSQIGGTMPVVRSDLKQTSFMRKLMTYYAGWKAQEHTRLYGCGSRIFLFNDAGALLGADVLACPWWNGRWEEVQIVG